MKYSIITRLCLIFYFTFSSVGPVFSAALHLKSGDMVKGTITLQTQEKVAIDPGFGLPITYYMDEIDHIDPYYKVKAKPLKKSIDKYTLRNAKFIPPDENVLLIVGQDKYTIKNYLNNIDIVPGGFTVYTSIQKMDGLNKAANHGGGVQHAQYLADHYPNSVIQIGLYMVGGLDGVIQGRYDRNIKKLGKWFLKNHDRPFFLRIGYEFDNPGNNYKPVKYVNVYKYIVMRLRMMGVDNVAYVWHSYAAPAKHPLMEWYPGDEFVDWVAISYFSPHNKYGMNKIAKIGREHNKPLMIAEATPVGMSTSKGDYTWERWFKAAFDYIQKNDVKIFCYINCHWDKLRLFKNDGWGDARIQMNSLIKKNWIDTISNETFLKASPDLFEKLRFNQI